MISFLLAVLVSGLIIGGGITIGVALAIWTHDRHRLKIDEMNRKAYTDARFMEVKRMNSEQERQLALRRKYAELPKTPEEEQKSFEDSLRALDYTEEEIAEKLKSRRQM